SRRAARIRARFGPARVPARRNQMSRSIRRGHRRLAVYFAVTVCTEFAANSCQSCYPSDRCAPGVGEMLQTKGIVGIAVAVVLGLLLVAPLTMAKGTRIELQAGPFAPGASGEMTFLMEGGVLSGELKARSLPAQGVHAFYVPGLVRPDLG